MIRTLQPNAVLAYAAQDNPRRIRILSISKNQLSVYVIDLDEKNSKPVRRSFTALQAEINHGKLEYCTDPFAYLALELPKDAEEKYGPARDRLIEEFKAFIQAKEEAYNKKTRATLTNEIAEATGREKKQIRSKMRQWWVRGETPNAFLSDDYLKGSRGKPRRDGEYRKRGRKNSDGTVSGINMTGELAQHAITTLRREFRSKKPRPLTQVFDDFNEKHFIEKDKNGKPIYVSNPRNPKVLSPKLLPIDQRFSIRQFRYLANEVIDSKQKQIYKHGQRNYLTDHRPKFGRSQDFAFGFGDVFVIDWARANIPIVHSQTGDVIGYPKLYGIRDLSTTAIVAVYMTLENASFLTAMTAAYYAFTSNKAALYDRYGVVMDPNEMPSGLCGTLLFDGGEFAQEMVVKLARRLRLNVAKTASWRADQKSLAEKYFDVLDSNVFSKIRGFNKGQRKRGEQNPLREAAHTYDDLMNMVLTDVLEYNATHWINGYPLTDEMRADKLLSQPLDLMVWNIDNFTGPLRTMHDNVLKVNLLPPATARVKSTGIELEGLTFHSELAKEWGWFDRADQYGSWDIEVAYEPRRTREIFLRPDDPATQSRIPMPFNDPKWVEDIACPLILPNAYNEAFVDCTWWDVAEQNKEQKVLKKSRADQRAQSKAHVNSNIKFHIEQAKKQREESSDTRTPLQRMKDIPGKRLDERNTRRVEEALNALDQALPPDDEPDDTDTSSPDELPPRANASKFIKDLFNRNKDVADS